MNQHTDQEVLQMFVDLCFPKIEWRNGIPLTKNTSTNNCTLWWIVFSYCGTWTVGIEGITLGLSLSLHPLTAPKSFPNISCAIISSFAVYGQFKIILLSSISRKCCIPGLPTFWYSSLTSSARLTCCGEYNDFLSVTVWTNE